MKKRYLLLPLLIHSGSITLCAELDPVIHSSKQDIKSSDMLDSSSYLDSDDLEMSSENVLDHLISKLPGVGFSSTAPVGGVSSIFVRGTESKHTIILMDGVRIHDPTSIGRSLNLGILQSSDIERIELIKGTQSVLYGSDAVGGVINIITKKGKGKHRIGGGTGYYNHLRFGNSFVFDKNSLSIQGGYFDSKHLSAAKDESEKDLYVNKGFTVNHQFYTEHIESETLFKYTNAHTYVDAYDSTEEKPVDDDDAYGKNIQTFFKQRLLAKVADQRSIEFNVSFSKYDKKNKYFDSNSFVYEHVNFEGDTFETELKVKEDFLDGNIIYGLTQAKDCLLYTSPSPRDGLLSRMPSSA